MLIYDTKQELHEERKGQIRKGTREVNDVCNMCGIVIHTYGNVTKKSIIYMLRKNLKSNYSSPKDKLQNYVYIFIHIKLNIKCINKYKNPVIYINIFHDFPFITYYSLLWDRS